MAARTPSTAANNTASNNATNRRTTSNNTTTNNTTSNNTASNTATPSVTITAPDNPGSGGTFGSYNFSTNLPPVGTSFAATGSILKLTPTSIGGAGLARASASDTATFQGTFTSNGVTYSILNLNIQSVGFTANNVRGDGTTATTNTGGTVNAAISTLNYTVLGAWTYTPPGGGTSYIGQSTSGFLTPDSALPTTGSATYVGNNSTAGGAIGVYAVNTSDGTLQTGTLSGNVSVTANFGPNTVSGTMTNMSATPTGNSTPTLEQRHPLGQYRRCSARRNNIFGTTAAAGFPSGAGAAAFTTAAQGPLQAPFMVRMREFGATWTLYESTNGGKNAAFGTIAGAAITTP